MYASLLAGGMSTAIASIIVSGWIVHCKCVHNRLQVEPKVGGKFVILRGAVTATFTALEPGKHIAMDWRFTSYPDDATSKVRAYGLVFYVRYVVYLCIGRRALSFR
jgi:hypothetical protein